MLGGEVVHLAPDSLFCPNQTPTLSNQGQKQPQRSTAVRESQMWYDNNGDLLHREGRNTQKCPASLHLKGIQNQKEEMLCLIVLPVKRLSEIP